MSLYFKAKQYEYPKNIMDFNLVRKINSYLIGDEKNRKDPKKLKQIIKNIGNNPEYWSVIDEIIPELTDKEIKLMMLHIIREKMDDLLFYIVENNTYTAYVNMQEILNYCLTTSITLKRDNIARDLLSFGAKPSEYTLIIAIQNNTDIDIIDTFVQQLKYEVPILSELLIDVIYSNNPDIMVIFLDNGANPDRALNLAQEYDSIIMINTIQKWMNSEQTFSFFNFPFIG